tara:strand:- start:1694 stop:2317 length:624 start_codon:yes stop_codon:yes gene_type:complete
MITKFLNIKSRAPFGYEWVDGELTEHIVEQEIISILVELNEAGCTFAMISEELKKRGYFTKDTMGQAPFGYKWSSAGELVKHPDEFPVREILTQLRESGLTYAQIADDVNDAYRTIRTARANRSRLHAVNDAYRTIRRNKDMMTEFKTPDDPKTVHTTSEMLERLRRIFQLRIDELDLDDEDDRQIHDDLTDLLSRIELVLNEVGSG